MREYTDIAKPDRAILQARRAALGVACLAAFLMPFMGSALNVAMPVMGREFSMTAVQMSWIATSYLLAAAIFLVPFGKIADIHGRKRIFSWGVLGFSLTSALCALAPNAASLIFFRGLQGACGAMIFGTGVAILTSVFPPQERGRVLGLNVAAVYSGLSCGPFIGGIITQYAGWRAIFWLNIPAGLIILAAVAWKLKGEWAEARGESLDVLGCLIYGVSLAGLMIGVSRLPELLGFALMAAGSAGMAGFIAWQLKVRVPVLNMALFKSNTIFALSNAAALINYAATFALTFLLSVYLQFVKGMSPRDTGILLVCQPIVMAIVSPFAGSLSDKIEPRWVASLGMAINTVGLGFFAFLNPESSQAFLIILLAWMGLGFALFSSPNTNAIMSSVERRSYGVASAMMGTMRVVGQVLSMGIATSLFSVHMGQTAIRDAPTGALMDSLSTCFVIFAVLCAIGVPASLARGRLRG